MGATTFMPERDPEAVWRDEHEPYRRLSRAVIDQARTDAKVVEVNDQGVLSPVVGSYKLSKSLFAARQFLTDEVKLELWCSWINIRPELIVERSRALILDAQRREVDMVEPVRAPRFGRRRKRLRNRVAAPSLEAAGGDL